ncbi:DUF6843 domain-containing protein [Bacillus xiapuensis]|uniref:DUF6843 domain-containing protein n=1 Tax=Bacillus xiapuensis TaxID=2014075 RepID=UPI000C247B95|nr:hypothetical protein [Bacillus xiapuensis]
MKDKRILPSIIILIFIGWLVYMFITRDERYSVSYELPMGFKGCAIVVYDVKDAPALKIKNQNITYRFNDEGVLYTSSPYDFGWEGENGSGFHDTTYAYVDEKGKKVSELSTEDIIGHNHGSYENDKFQVESFGVKIEDGKDICLNKIERLLK